ncbi:kinase [Paenibacillus thermoaerophilus]|nr:kinase [Paenibacillus thermoaerophilus]
MTELKPGDPVRARYKSGEYAGILVEASGPRAVVEIRAVLSHPLQGDLHHPYEADVPLFHQRRALAYREKALVPKADIEPFAGEIPDYADSLRQAVKRELDRLAAMDGQWARMAERSLRELEQDYFK